MSLLHVGNWDARKQDVCYGRRVTMQTARASSWHAGYMRTEVCSAARLFENLKDCFLLYYKTHTHTHTHTGFYLPKYRPKYLPTNVAYLYRAPGAMHDAAVVP